MADNEPLLQLPDESTDSEYSTTVIRSSYQQVPPSLSSILTVRPSPDLHGVLNTALPESVSSTSESLLEHGAAASVISEALDSSSIMSIATLDSYHTASASSISSAYATEGGSTVRSLHYVAPLVHRFTLLKPGKQKKNSGATSLTENTHPGWNPLELLFSSGLLVGKCDLCSKRIGWKPALECDDCGLRYVFIDDPDLS